ncbi:uncharacterized protein BDZ99DRAFT_479615 [Mytilinidion resinicola]|uniref:Uncharacterized protein n=1 Tax=Mytilinidion resinicola TaxID=574789 RepID=A0A6A6YE47_9PEZI|nr:uncharacterized protein BDZ99DRAFT_479615 [Mytilinidion resinicola]KAF2806355.1 hypothetical protein BDZ99DRAFT_479615 [Mytilinidion resinicola]
MELARSTEQYTPAQPCYKTSEEERARACDPEQWRELIGLIITDGMDAQEHTVDKVPIILGKLGIGRYVLQSSSAPQQPPSTAAGGQPSTSATIAHPQSEYNGAREAIQTALQQLSGSGQQHPSSTATDNGTPTSTLVDYIPKSQGNRWTKKPAVPSPDMDVVNIAEAMFRHPFNKESPEHVIQDLMAGDATVLADYKARLQKVLDYVPHLQRRATFCLIFVFFTPDEILASVTQAGFPISMDGIKGRIKTYLNTITPPSDYPMLWKTLSELNDNIRKRISIPSTPAPFNLVPRGTAEGGLAVPALAAPASPIAGPSAEMAGDQGHHQDPEPSFSATHPRRPRLDEAILGAEMPHASGSTAPIDPVTGMLDRAVSPAPPQLNSMARMILQIIGYGLSVEENRIKNLPEASSTGGIGHYKVANGAKSLQKAVVDIMLNYSPPAGGEVMLTFVPSSFAQNGSETEPVYTPFLASNLAQALKNHLFEIPKEQLADSLAAIPLDRQLMSKYKGQTMPILRYAPHLHTNVTLLLLLLFHTEKEIVDANHHLGCMITIEDVDGRVDQAFRNVFGADISSKKAVFLMQATKVRWLAGLADQERRRTLQVSSNLLENRNTRDGENGAEGSGPVQE